MDFPLFQHVKGSDAILPNAPNDNEIGSSSPASGVLFFSRVSGSGFWGRAEAELVASIAVSN